MTRRRSTERAEALAARLAGQSAASDAELDALAALADDLTRLGSAVAPAAPFRAQLARALATAPLPAALADVASVPTTTVVQQLDTSLEALRVGAADLDGLLAEHPATAQELAPLLVLAGALGDLPGVPSPSAAFRRDLAAELAMAPEPTSLRARRVAGGGIFARLWRNTAVAAAMAAVVVMFLAFGASYASANALPGQPLYPVKRGLELARLWVLSGESELAWRLDLAQRRLSEALTVPAAADASLSDFNHEITAGVALAERAMAGGTPREHVVPPLLLRLTVARGELITGKPVLPPIAWRSSLALVDTAIGLLRDDRALSALPILRLFGPAIRVPVAVGSGRRVAVLPWPPAIEIPVVPPASPAGGGSTAGGAAGGGAIAAIVNPAPVLVALAPPASAAPGGPGGVPVGPTAGPVPTEAPPATDRPDPTARPTGPTRLPTNVPSATAAPTEPPTVVPPSPTAALATPSPTPNKLPPVIKRLAPDVWQVPLGGRILLGVTAVDQGDDCANCTYQWTSTWGEMLDADKPDAVFHAIGNMSGMALVVTITVRVTDQDGNWTEGSLDDIEVVPRAAGGTP